MSNWIPIGVNAAAYIGGSLLGTWQSSPRVTCVVECPPPPPVADGLLAILREQLARCGPQNLTQQACRCDCDCGPGAFSVAVLFLTAFVAFACGLASGLVWSRIAPVRPPAVTAAVPPAISDPSALSPSSIGRARIPPGRIAALRDASA